MKVITPTAQPRVTAIEFTDAELQLIETALDDLSDRDADNRPLGAMTLWTAISELMTDELGLDFIEPDGSSDAGSDDN